MSKPTSEWTSVPSRHPMHSDDQLDAMRERVLERWDVDPSRVEIAAEGAEVAMR
jgi:hypothetical protein